MREVISHAVATTIKDQICLRHGYPNTIISDNGRQFIGKEVTQLLRDMHIKHRLTASYAPQCSPVERTNRVLKTMIVQNITKSQKTYHLYLPELQFAYNTAASTSTGFIPAYLNQGREFQTPASLAHETALPRNLNTRTVWKVFRQSWN